MTKYTYLCLRVLTYYKLNGPKDDGILPWQILNDNFLTISIDFKWILKYDQCHWKYYLFSFPCIDRTSKTESICDLDIRFGMDCS
jgi:hypothetical protein